MKPLASERGFVVAHGGARTLYQTTCSKCGVVGSTSWQQGPKAPADGVVAMLERKGWRLGSKRERDVCPECSKGERKMEVTVVEKSKSVPLPAVSADENRVRRSVNQVLALYFDPERGVYAQGYTDEVVAKETGAAPEFVRKFREEMWGPLRVVEDEAAKLRKQLSSLVGHGRQWMSEVERARFQAVEAQGRAAQAVAVCDAVLKEMKMVVEKHAEVK
ncbi:hypothetical protein UFOVP706_46 [uncultured Caudovirales phage]|uniref:Uncharacterized protein n=1 Tax=uncultured Caudovirales phage TaxID=2100421 RepID=A0A6J5NI76_9CAUD|nr:hypothetical protein UFOVP706_46 [uncultured Caudovirales phage]